MWKIQLQINNFFLEKLAFEQCSALTLMCNNFNLKNVYFDESFGEILSFEAQ